MIRGPIHEQGFLILPKDGRVIFVLPWCQNYTLIGTTESVYQENQFDHISISPEEEEYLYAAMREFFPSLNLEPQDILYKYSGVRSLIDSGGSNSTSLSRESIVTEDWDDLGGGYLAIFGGKLTTYRSMGEKVINKVQKRHEPAGKWVANTQNDPLPGGARVCAKTLSSVHAESIKLGVDESLLKILKFRYGSRWIEIIRLIAENRELLTPIGNPNYLKAEIAFAIREEMAKDLDDFILRRTKIAYELDEAGKKEVLKVIEEMK